MLVKDIDIEEEIPIMMTYFVLQIPNIIIIPSIEELQNNFSKVITNIIETHKKIFMWGQRYSTDTRAKPLGNRKLKYYKKKFKIDNKYEILIINMKLAKLIHFLSILSQFFR